MKQFVTENTLQGVISRWIYEIIAKILSRNFRFYEFDKIIY